MTTRMTAAGLVDLEGADFKLAELLVRECLATLEAATDAQIDLADPAHLEAAARMTALEVYRALGGRKLTLGALGFPPLAASKPTRAFHAARLVLATRPDARNETVIEQDKIAVVLSLASFLRVLPRAKDSLLQVQRVVAHEVRHAADAAYQWAAGAELGTLDDETYRRLQDMTFRAPKRELEQYLNLDSELKSFAGELASILVAEFGPRWTSVAGHPDQWPASAKKVWQHIRPENRRDFLSRLYQEATSLGPRREGRLVQRSHDGKTEWALVSREKGRVLKWFGPTKPSEEAVAKEERRIEYFKHQGAYQSPKLDPEVYALRYTDWALHDAEIEAYAPGELERGAWHDAAAYYTRAAYDTNPDGRQINHDQLRLDAHAYADAVVTFLKARPELTELFAKKGAIPYNMMDPRREQERLREQEERERKNKERRLKTRIPIVPGVPIVPGQPLTAPPKAATRVTAAGETIERAIDELAGNDPTLRQQYEGLARRLLSEGVDADEIDAPLLTERRQAAQLIRDVERTPGAVYAGGTPDYYVVRIDSYEASRRFGTRNWCVVRAEKWWKKYTKFGVRFFYYIDRKTAQPVYAVAISPRGDEEIYDRKDDMVTAFFEDLGPVLSGLDPEQRAQQERVQIIKQKISREPDPAEAASLVMTTPHTAPGQLVAAALMNPQFEQIYAALTANYTNLDAVDRVLQAAFPKFPEKVAAAFGLDPNAARDFAKAGASFALYNGSLIGGIPVTQFTRWHKTQLGLSHWRNAEALGYKPSHARTIAGAGAVSRYARGNIPRQWVVSFEKATGIKSPSFVVEAHDSGVTPEDLREFDMETEDTRIPEYIAAAKQHQVPLREAGLWFHAGVKIEEAVNLRREDVTPEQYLEWRRAGLTPSRIRIALRRNIPLERALAWNFVGGDSMFSEMALSDRDPAVAKSYEREGLFVLWLAHPELTRTDLNPIVGLHNVIARALGYRDDYLTDLALMAHQHGYTATPQFADYLKFRIGTATGSEARARVRDAINRVPLTQHPWTGDRIEPVPEHVPQSEQGAYAQNIKRAPFMNEMFVSLHDEEPEGVVSALARAHAADEQSINPNIPPHQQNRSLNIMVGALLRTATPDFMQAVYQLAPPYVRAVIDARTQRQQRSQEVEELRQKHKQPPEAPTSTESNPEPEPAQSTRVTAGVADGQAMAQFYAQLTAVVDEVTAKQKELGWDTDAVPPQFYGRLVDALYGTIINGRKWAEDVIRTRAIPANQHKAVEMAVRALNVRSMPRNQIAWFMKNKPRLELLIAAQAWPERRSDETVTGDLPNEDVLMMGGLEVHNTIGARGATLDTAKEIINRAVAALNHIGFGGLAHGKIYLVGQIERANWAAWYQPSADEIYLRPGVRGSSVEESARHLVHEFGHRLWAELSTSLMKQWATHHTQLLLNHSDPATVRDRYPPGSDLGMTVNRKPAIVLGYDGGMVSVGDAGTKEPLGKVDYGRFLGWIREVETRKRLPSPYATKSAEEHFCEAFSLEAMGKLAPEHKPALDDILSGSRPRAAMRVTAQMHGRDIVVCIPRGRQRDVEAEETDVAQRMQQGERGLGYYWSMGRLPKAQPRRVYFAWDGAIRAYHNTMGMERNRLGNGGRILLTPTIHEIEPVACAPFRGYRYHDNVTRVAARLPFPTKEVAWQTLLDESGVPYPPDFVAADQAYKQWRRQYASHRLSPRPVYTGGELDAVNRALSLDGDNRVSGVFEGFERLTRNVRDWQDPRLAEAIEILQEVPGLERLRLPEFVFEQGLSDAETEYWNSLDQSRVADT